MQTLAHNLAELYKQQEALIISAQWAKQRYQITKNEKHRMAMLWAEEELEEMRQFKRILDRENLEKLFRISQSPNFPHSVRAWLEDEYKDLFND